ncbi:MAG: TolB family protein, partial [Nevskiaceae bacterium]
MTYRYTARTLLSLLVTSLVLLDAVPATAQGAAPPRSELGALVLDGVPAPSARVGGTLDAWLAGRSASFQDFLADGSVLISTRFGDVAQIHRVAAPGADREQLTFEAEPATSARAQPDARPGAFVFARDRGGNENAQLYVYSLSDRGQRRLTDGVSRHGGALWSRDGKRLAFHGNARNGTQQDIYISDLGGNAAPRLVIASQGQTWSPADWSPDNQRLLLVNYISVTDAELYVAEVSTGAIRKIALPQTGLGGAKFSADGRGVFFTADLGGEFQQLRYVDVEDGSVRTLSAELVWDIVDFVVGPVVLYVAFVAF